MRRLGRTRVSNAVRFVLAAGVVSIIPPRTPRTGSLRNPVRGSPAFTDLPAGRYLVSAGRSGYLTLSYGQRRSTDSVQQIERSRSSKVAPTRAGPPVSSALQQHSTITTSWPTLIPVTRLRVNFLQWTSCNGRPSHARCERLAAHAARTAARQGTKTIRPMAKSNSRRDKSKTAGDRRNSRATVSGPTNPDSATSSSSDDLAAKFTGTQELAAAFPFNANKPLEYDPEAATAPEEGQSAVPGGPDRGLQHRDGDERIGQGRQRRTSYWQQQDHRPARPRARRLHRPAADDQSGRARRRQPELAQGRPARADAARRLHPAREDHAFRSRAHPRAHRPRPRLGGARLLRVLQAPRRVHARLALRGGRQADAGVRPLFDRPRRARLDRYRARRPRLRGEVLHRRGQLGPRRQQHPGVLHPGRDEVPRPGPRGEARAALRDAAGRLGARHLLGLRVADARDHRHADVGDVGSRDPPQLPDDAGVRRAHVPARQRGGRVALRQVPLDAGGRHPFAGVGRGGEDLGRRSRLPSSRSVGSDRGRRVSGVRAGAADLHRGAGRRLHLRRARRDQDRAGGARAGRPGRASSC